MKIAVCLNVSAADATTNVDAMLSAERLRPEHQTGIFSVARGAIGSVSAGERNSAIPLHRTAENGNRLWVTGVPISTGAPLGDVLDAACRADHAAAAEILGGLDGAFAAVLWDFRHQRLAVVTDFLGAQPLYMARVGDAILLASELKAMPAAGAGTEMDPAGWGAFIAMGHFLGDTTSLAGVGRVPAATVMFCDPKGRVEQRTYWRWPAPRPGAVDTACLVEALQCEVRGYAAHYAPGTVLLSGGFDSRLILCLLRSQGIDPEGLIVSHPGERLDADGRYARELAVSLGVKYRFCEPPAGFFSSPAYIDYMVRNEVATPTLRLFIAQVSAFVTPEIGAVWEGVGPGYGLAFPRIPRPDLHTYVRLRHVSAASAEWRSAERLFARGKDMHAAFDEALAAETRAAAPGEAGLLQFELRHQMRNRMGHNPLKVYSNDVLCYTPCASREFWTFASGLTYARKWNFKLYFELFERHFPEALKVPFCSMGRMWSHRPRFDARYHLARLFPPPGAAAAASLLKSAGLDRRNHLPLVDKVIAQVDPGHPDLCPDFVAALQRNPRDGGAVAGHARTLLFHWQMWRWIMEGRVHPLQRQSPGPELP